MTAVRRLTYPKPARTMRATVWSARWRRRWHDTIGAVFVDQPTGDLVAEYPATLSQRRRTDLQAEIEGRAHGAAQVVAACKLADEHRAANGMTEEYARDWVRRWQLAGGRVRLERQGIVLDQGFNSDAMVQEWAIVGPTIIKMVSRARARAAPPRRRYAPGGRR